MSRRIVFPEPSVPYDGSQPFAESDAEFYLKSTRPEAKVARNWINTAYKRFEDPTDELFRRLQSTDQIQHVSAIAELFVHDSLVKRHDRVIHEEGGIGPDFRMYRNEEYVGAIEVCFSVYKERMGGCRKTLCALDR